jgi:hypothetical protein
MSNKTLKVFRSIVRNINKTPINKISQGNIIYIERLHELPFLLDIMIMNDTKNNIHRSISHHIKEEIKKESSYLKIGKLYELDNIINDDILISQINEKKLNEIIYKIENNNNKVKIRYLKLGALKFTNLI